jgi:hypothetical protein
VDLAGRARVRDVGDIRFQSSDASIVNFLEGHLGKLEQLGLASPFSVDVESALDANSVGHIVAVVAVDLEGCETEATGGVTSCLSAVARDNVQDGRGQAVAIVQHAVSVLDNSKAVFILVEVGVLPGNQGGVFLVDRSSKNARSLHREEGSCDGVLHVGGLGLLFEGLSKVRAKNETEEEAEEDAELSE